MTTHTLTTEDERMIVAALLAVAEELDDLGTENGSKFAARHRELVEAIEEKIDRSTPARVQPSGTCVDCGRPVGMLADGKARPFEPVEGSGEGFRCSYRPGCHRARSERNGYDTEKRRVR